MQAALQRASFISFIKDSGIVDEFHGGEPLSWSIGFRFHLLFHLALALLVNAQLEALQK